MKLLSNLPVEHCFYFSCCRFSRAQDALYAEAGSAERKASLARCEFQLKGANAKVVSKPRFLCFGYWAFIGGLQRPWMVRPDYSRHAVEEAKTQACFDNNIYAY